MARSRPEWISVTLVPATLVEDGVARRATIRVGVVRLPGRAGVRVASQVEGREELWVLPPTSIARIMGALREGLGEL